MNVTLLTSIESDSLIHQVSIIMRPWRVGISINLNLTNCLLGICNTSTFFLLSMFGLNLQMCSFLSFYRRFLMVEGQQEIQNRAGQRANWEVHHRFRQQCLSLLYLSCLLLHYWRMRVNGMPRSSSSLSTPTFYSFLEDSVLLPQMLQIQSWQVWVRRWPCDSSKANVSYAIP